MRKGIEYNLGPRTVHSTPFDFFAGAVVNPYKVHEADQMMQFYKLQLKIAAGAQFIITQLGYNLRKLYELKQYMDREGLGHVPVLANVYVPTAKIAQMMQAGEVAGCVIPDELIQRLEKEKKPERLERAALMVAAVKDLGFAGAHIGGFGLTHRDFMTIAERAAAHRQRLAEQAWTSWSSPIPTSSTCCRQAADGLSDGAGKYQLNSHETARHLFQWLSKQVHRHLIADGSFGRALLRRPPEDQRERARELPGVMACGTGCWSLPRSTARPRWDARAAATACRTTSTTPVAPCAGATRNCATAPAAARESTAPARLAPNSFAFGT